MASPRGSGARTWLRRLLSDDTGMVTVEGAYAIAAIVAVLILSVGAITAFVTQIRCTDAAREVARLTAAGDASAREVGAQVAGSDATVVVAETGERITVDVSRSVRLLPMIRVSARAVAAPEPDGTDLVDVAPGVQP